MNFAGASEFPAVRSGHWRLYKFSAGVTEYASTVPTLRQYVYRKVFYSQIRELNTRPVAHKSSRIKAPWWSIGERVDEHRLRAPPAATPTAEESRESAPLWTQDGSADIRRGTGVVGTVRW